MSHNGRRNADERLALAVASGQDIRHAARSVGVSERTAWRRWADAGFRRRVSELRAEATSRALGRLSSNMAAAADTLRKLLKAKSETVQLGAARAMLELAVRLKESTEFEDRLSALEKPQCVFNRD